MIVIPSRADLIRATRDDSTFCNDV